MRSRAVAPETLGAWVLKTNPDVTPVDQLIRSGFRAMTSRCLTRTYRTDLIEAGQPVLLWVSGNDPSTPTGIHAQGRTTGRPAEDLAMPIDLGPVDSPVLRTELIEHAVLAQIEVLRMPAGSNPSFITREQFRELANRWPQVSVATG